MPCDSNIRETQIKDAARAAESMRALGLTVTSETATLVTTTGLTLSRRNATDAFVASGAVEKLAAVGRKYAEISTRAWAKRSGLNVRSSSESGMVLVSQKGS